MERIPGHQKRRNPEAWNNNQADQVAGEVAIQEPILVMGLQETPAGKWDWTKGWCHLKYIEEERTQIASHPTYQLLPREGRTMAHTRKPGTLSLFSSDDLGNESNAEATRFTDGSSYLVEGQCKAGPPLWTSKACPRFCRLVNLSATRTTTTAIIHRQAGHPAVTGSNFFDR